LWHAWERREKCTVFWWESPKERDHSEDQGIDGKMESEWDVRKIGGWRGGGGAGVHLVGSRLGMVVGSCEYGDEPLGSGAMELHTHTHTCSHSCTCTHARANTHTHTHTVYKTSF
jgi:hypothetical protein